MSPIVHRLGRGAAWQTSCTCGWASSPEPTRPEAIRAHTVHAMQHRAAA